jgi:uncharacterized protein YukE
VITTCTGHVEEEYADIALLLRDEHPPALARLIEEAAKMDPYQRALKGRAAQEYILAHNQWISQGQRVAQFIRELASASNVTQ